MPPGLQLSRAAAELCGCCWVCNGVHVSGSITRGLNRLASCLAPGKNKLRPGPWSVELVLGKEYASGFTVGFADGGPVTRRR